MKKYFIVFLILFSYGLNAQKINHEYQQWYVYIGNYKISNKLAVHAEVQARVQNGFEQMQQLLLRSGLQYFTSDKTNVALGYAFIDTYNFSQSFFIPEHRIWQQFIYNAKIKNVSMINRLRLEQRFVAAKIKDSIGNTSIKEWRYGNRFRCFNRTLIPLSWKAPKKSEWYLAFQEEIFLNFANKEINKNFLDQNRLFTGIGLYCNNTVRYEIGYLNQFVNPVGADIDRHIFQLAVYHNIDFTN